MEVKKKLKELAAVFPSSGPHQGSSINRCSARFTPCLRDVIPVSFLPLVASSLPLPTLYQDSCLRPEAPTQICKLQPMKNKIKRWECLQQNVHTSNKPFSIQTSLIPSSQEKL
ncbi:hypothetical protein AMECASPLE_007627 [Ameca splendens]|uniref:Uncharacterized protein n=1 Tax=Ameca splendens TaxID=208324 RepID=A0ABV0ZAT1_9TELE